MYTAAQYRAAEQDYAGRGKLAEPDSQRREYRALEGSFRTLADNQDWVDDNGNVLVAAPVERVGARRPAKMWAYKNAATETN